MPTTRPTRWLTRRRVLWAALALLALWLAWQVYDIITGKPQPSIDYASQFYELCSSAQGEGENAWPLLVEVLTDVQAASDDLRISGAKRRNGAVQEYGLWSDVTDGALDMASLRPHVASIAKLRYEGLFDKMDRLAAMRRCVSPRIDDVPFSDAYAQRRFEYRSQLRQWARLMAARLRLSAHHDDWSEFIRTTDQALAIIRLAELQPSLMDHLVTTAILPAVAGELRLAAVNHSMDEATALALLDVLERRDDLPSVQYIVAGERLLLLDHLQNIYTTSGRLPYKAFGQYRGNPMAVFMGKPDIGPRRGAVMDVAAIVIPGHDEAIRLSELYFRQIEIEVAGDDSTPPLVDFATWMDTVPLNQIVIPSILIGDPALYADTWKRMALEIESARLMLAIEAYIARHDFAPQRLDDLTPDIVAALPLDPYSGRPFGYRRLDLGRPARTYYAWSCGADGQDDDGYYGQESPWHFGEPGTDVWLNRPRN